MKRALTVAVLSLLAWASCTWAAEAPQRFDGPAPLEWSRRMADSEMIRLGVSPRTAEPIPAACWDYTRGVLAFAIVRLGEEAHNDTYIQFGTRVVASCVGADGTIEGYSQDNYSLDNIQPGNVLLTALDRGSASGALVKAVGMLRRQIATQPRTKEGGFWHKKRYPNQMWLDGLYMAAPFMAHYAVRFREPALFGEAVWQIILVDRHTYDRATGLYWHAWDETRTQQWANRETGASPLFWSRAIGWYAMAIVDSLDYLPADQPERGRILEIFHCVADGIVRWQDPATSLWWQVTDLGGRKGNYIEASGSAMFIYALAKGVNRGYLPRDGFVAPIEKGYEGLIRRLVKTDADGLLVLTQICQSAGLGYTMANGRPRDGSFEYYTSEPIVENDPKGTGPFILAGIEMQRLQGGTATAP